MCPVSTQACNIETTRIYHLPPPGEKVRKERKTGDTGKQFWVFQLEENFTELTVRTLRYGAYCMYGICCLTLLHLSQPSKDIKRKNVERDIGERTYTHTQ